MTAEGFALRFRHPLPIGNAMTQLARSVLTAGMACMLLVIARVPLAAAADDPALLAADRDLMSALRSGNATAAANLLDADASWTDEKGRTVSKGEAGKILPKPAIADETGADVHRHEYGRVGVVRVDKGLMHTMRVWIKRGNDWRLLAYQEVRSLAAPPTATPGIAGECINPCREVPYTPKTDNERGVIAAYQALETSSHAADASTWGKHVADEFVVVSSNSDRSLTKDQRLEGLRRATKNGVSPTRLTDAQMTDLDGVVVMRGHHTPDNGNPLRVTRVWVKRNNVWQSTLSYQTAIAAAN
ncbi:MAG: nuclear transport factor 2 family protein [Steroidobacteraceae bacterium]